MSKEDAMRRHPTERFKDGEDSLPIEERNNARLQALGAIGVGLNGINEALTLMMLERLLGEVATSQVKQAHQEWLAGELDKAEEKVKEIQRRQSLLLPGQN